MVIISFIEGNLQLGIELAPGTLDRLKASLAQLEKGVAVKINIDPKPIQQGTQAVAALESAVNRTSSAISQRLGGAVKATGAALGALAAVGGAGLIAIGTKAILAGKEFNVLQQQVRAGLKAILGTTDATNELLGAVNTLNNTSPFPRQAFLSATQQLVGFGIEAEKVVPILDAIQEAVAGSGGDRNDIESFTRAFAQIKSQGRLTGDIIQTLGARGIDAAEVIGDAMGKSGATIKKSIEAGTLGADAAIDALTTGLKTKFEGSVEGVSKTFIGAMDRVQARLRDIGALLTKAFVNPLGGGAAVDGLNNIAVGLKAIETNVISQLLPSLQQAANLFVSATKAFSDFTTSIKTDQVQKFLQVFQALLPLIAIFASRFAGSIIGQLPLLSKFGAALGGPITAIALIIATIPDLREAFIKLVDSLRPLVEALLPAFGGAVVSIQGAFIALSPILSLIVSTISTLASIVTPIITTLQRFGVLVPILTAIAIRFVAVRVAGSVAFGQLTAGLGIFIQRLATAGVATGTLTTRITAMGALGGQALRGVGSAIGSLITPANAALGIFTVISLELARAKKAADDLAASILKGLDLNKQEDQQIALLDLQNKRNEAQEKFDKLQGRVKSKELSGFDQTIPGKALNFFPNLFTLNDKKQLDEAKKALKEIEDQIAGVQSLQDQVGRGVLAGIAGTDLEGIVKLPDVLEAATKAGIDFSNLRPEKVGSAIKDIVKQLQEVPKAAKDASDKVVAALTTQADLLDKVRSATDALKGSQKALQELQKVTAQEIQDKVIKAQIGHAAALRNVAAAADRVTTAELNLAQARRGVISAQEHLNDLEKERARLLADTNAEARELAEADAAVARGKQDLIDIGQRETALLREQDDLAEERAGKLASAGRSVERAQIAFNTAKREELELKKELNKEDEISLDLTGLSVDQIKSTLAGARAQAAAQRSVTESKKSQEQINDEIRTAELNTADAQQGVVDSLEAQSDLEIDLGIQERENAEALQALELDREAALRRQEELVISQGVLRTGETVTAATLKRLDEEIVVGKEGITTAIIGVRTAEEGLFTAIDNNRIATIGVRDSAREVRDVLGESKTHAENIRNAMQKVKEDSQKVQEATALAREDNELINAALLARIGLNSTLLQQNPDLARKTAESILSSFTPNFQDESSSANFAQNLPKRINELTDIISRRPQDILKFLRGLGFPLADGAIVNRETFARIGEAGREVVLPLTRPARMADLLSNSQVLHPVLAALGRITLPSPAGRSIPPSAIKNISGSGGSHVVVRRADGPMTYGQAEDIINLLRENGAPVSVSAPITLESTVDENALMRKLSRQLERQINEILAKRR